MTIAAVIALSLALVVMAATPGPGVFAIIARALAQGFGPAAVQALGIIAGDLVWLAATLLGLAYVAAEYTTLFQAIKIAGGLYLVYLGVRMWRLRVAAATPDEVAVEDKSPRRGAVPAIFTSGLLTTLGNPKVMLFYVVFFPAFVDMSRLTPADGMVIAALSAAAPLTVLLVYAGLAARTRRLFRSPRAMKRLNRGAGTVMIAAGAAVATRG